MAKFHWSFANQDAEVEAYVRNNELRSERQDLSGHLCSLAELTHHPGTGTIRRIVHCCASRTHQSDPTSNSRTPRSHEVQPRAAAQTLGPWGSARAGQEKQHA